MERPTGPATFLRSDELIGPKLREANAPERIFVRSPKPKGKGKGQQQADKGKGKGGQEGKGKGGKHGRERALPAFASAAIIKESQQGSSRGRPPTRLAWQVERIR